MKNIVIVAEQGGKVEEFMRDGPYNWATYTQPRKSFDVVAAQFPEFAIEIEEGQEPRWGQGFYKRGANGELDLCAENWDTSG